MSTVISVENLSKIYRLGQIGTGTFSHDLNAWWAKLRGKPNPLRRIGEKDHGNRDGEELWALRDVSFTVEQGEVLGIIGRNGAGKSTLLKILSRVTAPTSGRIRVKGRIASLLEVGTGFHPELTGRENIYLNGAILGMTKQEVTRKFDEIVDFSEVEKFIDTPVKRYSSGMYVRLAFAVAAHLDPEILVVDEVLAVGDAEFQKKCLGKMGGVAKEGRTVLFVSHNMGSIQSLCRQGIYLRSGSLHFSSIISEVVDYYLKEIEKNSYSIVDKRLDRNGFGECLISKVEILRNNTATTNLIYGSDATFIFYISNPIPDLSCTFTVYDLNGTSIAGFHSSIKSPEDISKQTLDGIFSCTIEEVLFVPGRYRINVAIYGNGQLQDHLEGVLFFDVHTGLLRGRPPITGRNQVSMPHHWKNPK